MGQIAQVSLRLLAGAVSKRGLEGLKRTLEASPSEYPWQVVTKVVLSEPCDEQDLAQRGLRAQRDWILRGGRENPGKPIGLRAKTLLAKLVAQLLFFVIYTLTVLVLLLLLEHKWPQINIYQAWAGVWSTLQGLLPK